MSRPIHVSVRTSAVQAAECVRSLFALELLQPGPYLYLCASVLYNTVVLPSGMGQFGALFPEIDAPALRLDTALAALAARGVSVRIIHTPGCKLEQLLPAAMGVAVARPCLGPLHHQGLLTNKLCLRGSLHFLLDGIHLGGESVELISDTSQLQRLQLEMDAYWEELI